MGDDIVVSPEIFASVVVNTKSVKLVLTGIHFQAICREMAEKQDADIMVERMDLTIRDMNGIVDTDRFVSAICKLKELSISSISGKINENENICQKAMFEAINSCSDLKLKNLKMESTNLSLIPAETLASAVIKLESADLSHARLTTNQIETLCKSIIEPASIKLKSLNLCGNNNLRNIEMDTLTAVHTKLVDSDIFSAAYWPYWQEFIKKYFGH